MLTSQTLMSLKNTSKKLKAASKAHAGQSEILEKIYAESVERRRKVCRLVNNLARKANKAGRQDLGSDAGKIYKELKCGE